MFDFIRVWLGLLCPHYKTCPGYSVEAVTCHNGEWVGYCGLVNRDEEA